jgi:hypothetical protein
LDASSRENGQRRLRKKPGPAKRKSADDGLNELIAHQAERYRDENEALDQHPLWLESVERHAENLRVARNAEWSAFHTRLAVLHGRLAEEHRREAAKLGPG